MKRTLVRLLFALPLVCVAPFVCASTAHAQGLEPPPPMSPPPAPGSPEGYPQSYSASSSSPPPPASSDESDDSGLGLEWVWLNAEAGASYVDMQSFSASSFGLVNSSGGGPSFGVGAGVRLIFFTLGVRARDLSLSDIGNLWMLNLEAAFHTRIWRIDPYFGVRGGYNFLGSLSSSNVQVATMGGGSSSDVSVHGFNVGPMFGIDFYLAKVVSIGADVDSQFLFLQRPKPPLPCPPPATQDQCQMAFNMAATPQQKTLYDNSGSSVGFGFTAAAHLGLHF